ncbi:hypothetical protein [Nocardia salmonicida]|uniref:hypothetical protein n=1 Tax=Nocardia salmonicida TaxID=53431 RepID=UPI0034005388
MTSRLGKRVLGKHPAQTMELPDDQGLACAHVETGKLLRGKPRLENAMTPTTFNQHARSAARVQLHRTGYGSDLLPHPRPRPRPVGLNDRLIQHLNGLGDAVSNIAEQGNDGTAGVDDAMTEVITELDHIIFETHAFLSGIVSEPITTPS